MSLEDSVKKVEAALALMAAGEMVILVDDEDRENEGDLCMAAEKVTPEAVNFMACHGRGLICLSLSPERCAKLELPLMAARNTSPFGTAFTVSIEARHGVTTGISAADRATTIKTAVAQDAKPSDLVTPGHVFPLRAEQGGVLVRAGQTEGSVDLARLAGCEPAGVICEVMKDDGTMARMPELEEFAKRHGLMILSIADLICYRIQREGLVEEVARGRYLPGFDGITKEFDAFIYKTKVGRTEFMGLRLGDWDDDEPVLVRVHSACIGDAFNSQMCDCGQLLRESLKMIQSEGKGVVLYVMPHKLRLAAQFRGHVLHDSSQREIEDEDECFVDWRVPLRGFGLGAQVLRELGVRSLRLLTNNPKKIVGLSGFGLTVLERVPVRVSENRHNLTFIDQKRKRGEHEHP